MISPASSALNRVFAGTSTPPAVSRPKAAMIHSAELGAQIAARSPFPIPADAKAPAAAADPAGQLGEGEPERPVHDRFGVAKAVGSAQHHFGDAVPLRGGGPPSLRWALRPAAHAAMRRARLPPMTLAFSSSVSLVRSLSTSM